MENPYQPPESSLTSKSNLSQFYQRGRYVVMDPSSGWPARCFKCNNDTHETKKVVLTYVNPWIYLSILITPIITIILGLILRKRFAVELPLCDVHQLKHKRFLLFQWGAVALLFALMVMAYTTPYGFLGLVALVGFLVIVISAIFGRLAFAAKYKNDKLWVSGADKAFRNSLPEFVK